MIKPFLGSDSIDEWRPQSTVLRWGGGDTEGEGGSGFTGDSSFDTSGFEGAFNDSGNQSFDTTGFENAFNDNSNNNASVFDTGGVPFADTSNAMFGGFDNGQNFSDNTGGNFFDGGVPNSGGWMGGFGDNFSGIADAFNSPAIAGWGPGDYAAFASPALSGMAGGPYGGPAYGGGPFGPSQGAQSFDESGFMNGGPFGGFQTMNYDGARSANHDFNQGPMIIGPPSNPNMAEDLITLSGRDPYANVSPDFIAQGSPAHFATSFPNMGGHGGANVMIGPPVAGVDPAFQVIDPVTGQITYGTNPGLNTSDPFAAMTQQFGQPQGFPNAAPNAGVYGNQFTVDSKDQSQFQAPQQDSFDSRFGALPGQITGNEGAFEHGNVAPGRGGIFDGPDPATVAYQLAPVASSLPGLDPSSPTNTFGPYGPMEGGGQGGAAFMNGGPFGPAGTFQSPNNEARDTFEARYGGPYPESSQWNSDMYLSDKGDRTEAAGARDNFDSRFGTWVNDPGLDFSRPSSVNPNVDYLDAPDRGSLSNLPTNLERNSDADFNSRFGTWENLNDPNALTYIDPATTTTVGKNVAPEARDSFDARFGGPYQAPSMYDTRDEGQNQNMGRPQNNPTVGEFLGPGRGQSQNMYAPQLAPEVRAAIERGDSRAPLQVTVPGRTASQTPSQGRASTSAFGRPSQSQYDALLSQARTAPTMAGRIQALDSLNGLISARGNPWGRDPDPFIASQLRQGR